MTDLERSCRTSTRYFRLLRAQAVTRGTFFTEVPPFITLAAVWECAKTRLTAVTANELRLAALFEAMGSGRIGELGRCLFFLTAGGEAGGEDKAKRECCCFLPGWA